jgi:hypothetical protein
LPLTAEKDYVARRESSESGVNRWRLILAYFFLPLLVLEMPLKFSTLKRQNHSNSKLLF